ncbi:MAG: protein phosphatase 2C domain-containing protein [Verrucomicrobiota bacterium]
MLKTPIMHSFGRTDRGLVRSENEDCFHMDEANAVFAVADGLGGLPEGSLASEVAIAELKNWLKDTLPPGPIDYSHLFSLINEEVFKRGREISSELGIGTTLTVAHLHGKTLTAGHVGDTGLVIFKQDSWRQVTQDHTMAQEMLDRLHPGEEAFIPEYFSHTLTRCIGQTDKIQTDVYRETLDEDDRILLFTDGVTKTMDIDELHELIFEADSPQAFVDMVIDTANERGGPDNTTAIAIFLET